MLGKPYNTKLNLNQASSAADRLSKSMGVNIPAERLRRAMIHGGSNVSSMVTRYASGTEKSPADLSKIEATLLVHGSKQPHQGTVNLGNAPAGPVSSNKPKKSKKEKKQPSSIPAHAVRLSVSKTDLTEAKKCCENCECDKCKLSKRVKQKYLKEMTIDRLPETKYETLKETANFDRINLDKFIGKKALIETVEGTFYGVLGTFKKNYALFENNTVKRAIDLTKVIKFISEGTKITVNFNQGEDSPLLQEKIVHRGGKVLVTNEAGTKVLGTHDSEVSAKKQLQAIHISQAKHLHETSELLLKENIRNRFFMAEEVVHKDHEFTMTDDEIYQRDKLADKLLKNPDKLKTRNGDTKEEAAHRLATSIIVCKSRGSSSSQSDKEGKLYHDMDDNEKTSRKKRRQGRDLFKGSKEEGTKRRKETVTDKRGRKVTRNVIKPGQKGVIKPQFQAAAEKLRKRKKGIPAEYFRNTANIKGGAGTTRAQFAKLRRANEDNRAKRKNT